MSKAKRVRRTSAAMFLCAVLAFSGVPVAFGAPVADDMAESAAHPEMKPAPEGASGSYAPAEDAHVEQDGAQDADSAAMSREEGAFADESFEGDAALSDPVDGDARADEVDADASAENGKELESVPAPLAPGTYVIASATGSRCVLDVYNGSKASGGNIQMWGSTMNSAQYFEITVDADGYATIENVRSGKVLDVANGSAFNGANVQQFESNGTPAQKWKVIRTEDGSYTFASALAPRYVLDVANGSRQPGANVQLFESNGTPAQQFDLYEVDPQVEPGDTFEEGVYVLRSALADGRVLDVSNAGLSNACTLQLFEENTTFAQMFTIAANGDGFYTISALHSGKAIDMTGGDVVPGRTLQQWGVSGEPVANQLWSIRDNGDGTVSVVSKTTGLAVAVSGSKDKNGTAIIAAEPSSKKGQKWLLEPVESIVPDGCYKITTKLGAGRSLDVAGSSPKPSNVQIWSWNTSTLAQRFKVRNLGDNVVTIESLCSGLLLTESDGTVATRDDASDASRWRVVPSASGGVSFVNVASGLAMDVAGGNDYDSNDVQVFSANQTPAQSFMLESKNPVGEGTYSLFNAVDGRVVEVAGGSREPGANIQMWDANDTGAQKWNLTWIGGASFTIENCKSSNLLDVQNGSTAAGANVQQWTPNGNSAQSWTVEYAGDGFYHIVSDLSGMRLEVANGGGASGSNVQVGAPSDSRTQLFRLIPATYVPEDFADRIATFTTWSTNTPEGQYNMQRALNEFDGIVLQPGETMSFFGVAGPCGAAQGYLPAGIVGGTGYGGGICQASTTLYGASIRAGLTIVERNPHSTPSTYVPIGLDAMVNFGTSDFVVRNDHDFPVKFVIYTPDNELTCEIYGIQPTWYDYIDAESWWTGSNTADARRVWYKNGVEVYAEWLPSSWYAY